MSDETKKTETESASTETALFEKLYEEAKTELKTTLGDLWDATNEDIADWLKLVAKVRYNEAAGINPEQTKANLVFVEAGIACLTRRISGQVEDSTTEFFMSFLKNAWEISQPYLIAILKGALV